jgi:hypothetical protein
MGPLTIVQTKEQLNKQIRGLLLCNNRRGKIIAFYPCGRQEYIQKDSASPLGKVCFEMSAAEIQWSMSPLYYYLNWGFDLSHSH